MSIWLGIRHLRAIGGRYRKNAAALQNAICHRQAVLLALLPCFRFATSKRHFVAPGCRIQSP